MSRKKCFYQKNFLNISNLKLAKYNFQFQIIAILLQKRQLKFEKIIKKANIFEKF